MRRIAAPFLALVMAACTTVVVSLPPQDAQVTPGGPDTGVDSVTPPDGGPGGPEAAQDAAPADAGVDTGVDTGADTAAPYACARDPQNDWICVNYAYGRKYLWDCPTKWPNLPACEGGACNCQGTLVVREAGAVYCCDVP